jgi:hypothetical protein
MWREAKKREALAGSWVTQKCRLPLGCDTITKTGDH